MAEHQTTLTQWQIEAGVAALGADDDRSSAEVVLDVWLAITNPVSQTTLLEDLKMAPKLADERLNIQVLHGLLARVDTIGYAVAHHLPGVELTLTIDEACNLAALLYQVTVQGRVP